MNNNIVVINGSVDNVMRQYEIDTLETFKKIPFILKPFRLLHHKLSLPGFGIWHTSTWLKKCDKYNMIILFDNIDFVELSKKIENQYQNKRLVVFFWNPIFIHGGEVLRKISSIWEIWTFDFEDKQRYNIKYSGQFFFDKMLSKPYDNCNLSDVSSIDLYFVGQDKGRFRYLFSLEKLFKDKKINTKFRFVKGFWWLVNSKYTQAISYAEVIYEISCSKAILEYNQDGQKGLTLRSLEAIWLGKKLVTNNAGIKQYDFYNPTNIFILGEDNLDNIYDFVSSPLVDYGEDVKHRYTFSAWMDRIKNNEQLDDFRMDSPINLISR
jgi:hypothetical protein